MDEFKITAEILDYIGKFENGVLVLLSVNCNDEWTEGTLYYSQETLALTVSEKIEEKLGHPIELWSGYKELLASILKRAIPYKEIINSLDEIDFEKYFKDLDPEFKFGEEIDESEIQYQNPDSDTDTEN